MKSPDELSRAVTGQLPSIGRIWRKLVQDVISHHGVAEAAAAPLVWIGRMGEGVRQTALAQQIGIEGPSLVRLIDQLSAAGLVTRTTDPADRRANLLSLTPEGRDVLAVIEAEIDRLRNEVLGSVSKADLEAVLRVYAAIREAAAKLDAQVEPAAGVAEAINASGTSSNDA